MNKQLQDAKDRLAYSENKISEIKAKRNQLSAKIIEWQETMKACADCLDMQEGYEPWESAQAALDEMTRMAQECGDYE